MDTGTTTLDNKTAVLPVSRFSTIGLLLLMIVFYYSSFHSFLLFHSLVEIFSVLVSFAIFVIAWNARQIIKNHYLLFLGIAFLFVGLIDLEHTLAYKGMDILGGWGTANHATQLWIAARYTESLALLIAPFYLDHRLRPRLVFTLFLLWGSLLVWSIHAGLFPTCFVAGKGLTPFKIISEYVISAILVASYLVLRRRRHLLNVRVYRLLVAAIFFTIASELAFTFYISVFGISNVFGHFFKFIAAYLIYLALIETGLRDPYALLFHELKTHEEILSAREAEFRSIFELSAAGMAKIELITGRFTLVNHQLGRITGYETEGLLGMRDTDITHPDDRRRHEEAFAQLVDGKISPYQLEKRYVREDGDIIWVKMTASLIRSETGLPLYAIAIIEDITPRKMLEQKERHRKEELEREVTLRTAELASTVKQLRMLALQLSDAENRERRRVADILHDDLQQLLAAANLHLDRLAGTLDTDQRRRLTTAVDILKQTIRVSRSLSHELSPAILYRGSLNAIFEWLASHKLENHGLDIAVTIPDDLRIESDTLRVFLFRSVQELLFNVVKHAGTNKASLTIAPVKNDVLRVEVADQGKGFDPEKLIDSGGQVSNAGFGLFSIRERLHLLGGSLRIDSKPGNGSRFVIHLPLHSVEIPTPQLQGRLPTVPEAAFHTPIPSQPKQTTQPIRILLADDHETIRQGLEALLRDEEDLEVVGQAGDGEQAIRLAGKLQPDVVVMDMAMPKMDGIEAIDHIHRLWPKMVIIAHSMHDDRDLAETALSSGASAYCTKSESAAHLLAAIRSHGRQPEFIGSTA